MFIRSIILLALPLMLSACHSFGQYSPQKMVQYSAQRQFFQDNQYQFSGEMRVHATPSEAADGHPSGQLAQHVLSSFSVPFQGSVDIPSKKIEIIPNIRYEHHNLLVSAQFPLQVDLQEPSLSVDAGAITHYADIRLPDDQKIRHRLLYLTPPADGPLSTLMKEVTLALPKMTDHYYSAIDSQAFQIDSIDDFGKEINAKYHVRLNLDATQQHKAFNAALESLQDRLKQKSDSVDDQKTYKAISQWLSSRLYPIADKSHYQDTLSKTPYPDLEQHYYFDSKGRLLGLRGNQQLPIGLPPLANLLRDISLETWLKIRYQKPVFILNSTLKNRINMLTYLTFLNRKFK